MLNSELETERETERERGLDKELQQLKSSIHLEEEEPCPVWACYLFRCVYIVLGDSIKMSLKQTKNTKFVVNLVRKRRHKHIFYEDVFSS